MKVLPRITPLLSLYALVAIAAAGLAAAMTLTEPATAYAANHCTRYAPIISQDYNCTVKGTMYNSSNGIYSTPSNGLRDQNTISLNSSRTWTIAYYGGNYSSASGTGTVGHIYSSNGYAQARCWFLGASVTGYCMTQWHD
jgi:hypothetical protein